LLDYRPCNVATAEDLDRELRDIYALINVGREDEIRGTLYVDYSDESVKQASLIPWLESRGVTIVWRKNGSD
jgi:hypothetical protein